MTIERFTGINPGVPYMGPLPGGGYRGATDELDALVLDAAERLRAEYGCDIQVRYNSDRRSGGAWLMPEDRYGLVGINGGLAIIHPEGESEDRHFAYYRDPWYRLGLDPDGNPVRTRLVVHSYVQQAVLVDPTLANSGERIGKPYSYRAHESVESALTWLRENARLS